MVFKNYKELCEFMGWEVIRGNSMRARLKELDSLCKWHREGQKIVVEMVYDTPKKKEDGRTNSQIGRRLLSDEEFKKLNTSGVYKLTDKNGLIYIGSSINVYERFKEHRLKNQTSTSMLLDKESLTVELFEFTKGIEDRSFLYDIERLIIKECIEAGVNLVNNRNTAPSKKKKKTLFKTIRIDNDKYEEAIKLLKANNLI